MIEMDFITLEDGLDYAIVDEIVINDVKYLYLVEEKSLKVELRKLNENEDLIEVADIKERENALIEFAKRHKNDLT